MYKIIDKKIIAPKVNRFEIEAPDIAKKRKAGQFVLILLSETGERIPLTIADADPEKGTITLVVQEVGKTTIQMGELKSGDSIYSLTGPLGAATHIEKFGTVVGIGGGIGIAPLHPIAQSMQQAGNKVISILGARNKELFIMEDEMRAASDEVMIVTDDGSYGDKGFVTDALKNFVAKEGKPNLVVAIGPPIMMKMVSLLTKELDIPTVVSLNTIMVDGTGMCGGCRVTIGDNTKYVCVDGPEFDGHLVDFDQMMKRQQYYHKQEKCALNRYKQHKVPSA